MGSMLVEHWWNQLWGRLNRRDLWLHRDGEIPEGTTGAWTLRVSDIDGDQTYRYATESEARGVLQRMLDTNDLGEMSQVGP